MKFPDLNRAFPDTPSAIHDNIMEAFERGERAMKFRNKIISLCSVAAALLIIISVALAAGLPELGKPRQDIVLDCQYTPAPRLDMNSTMFYTENGVYFHSLPNCSGMMNAEPHSIQEAMATGKGACPVCVNPAEILPYATPAVTPCPTPEPALKAESAVFCTEKGTYYHAIPDCSGMMYAQKHTIEAAEFAGKTPCPVCLAADANAWFSSSITPSPMPANMENGMALGIMDGANGEISYLYSQPTLTPANMAADTEIWDDFDIFRELFGREFPEVFPDYTIDIQESWEFDSGYVHWTVSNGKDMINIDENPPDGSRNGTLRIAVDNGAAAFRLMKNAPEPLHTIYMELAPQMIQNTLAAVGKNTAQAYRLGDIILMYSHDFDVTTAELTYYIPDGSIVHLAWKDCETNPELYFMQWTA